MIAPRAPPTFSPTGTTQPGGSQGPGSGGQNQGGNAQTFAPPTAPTGTQPPPTTTTQQPIILPTQVIVSAASENVGRPGTAVFEIIRVNNFDQTTTVGYSTVDGSATAGDNDYRPSSGSVTFAPGETSKFITVAVQVGGRLNPASESFSLAISGSQSVIVGGAASVTLAPPPPLPTISLVPGSVSVSDQIAGGTTVSFTLTRTGDATLPSSVTFQTVQGTALAGSDFGGRSETITFAPGEVTKTVTVSILANTIPLKFSNQEVAETFTVQLVNAQGANLGTASSTVTILPDPVVGLATFTISGATVSHGAGNTAVLTVTRGGDLVGEVTVNYATSNGSATSGVDFNGQTGKLTFAAGETTKTIAVPIIAATTNTPARQFSVVLSDADGGTISQGTGNVAVAAFTGLPFISISGASITATSATTAQVTVTLSAPSTDTVTVNYSTSNGSALSGTHYTGASGSVTFLPGETSKSIPINIAFVAANTSSVNFTVSLSSPVNGQITTGSTSATVTIIGVPPVVGPNISPTAGDAFLPATNPGNANPSGSTVAALFTGVFADANGNPMGGIAVISNTSSAQGTWQFSSDNGTTWTPIGAASLGAPVAIAATSLLRFVPAGGFFGVPPMLQAHVMDSTYTGNYSTSPTSAIVTVSSPSLGNGSSLAATASNINTAVLSTVTSVGGGDWTNASNWVGGVPNAGQLAVLSTGTLTLQNGTTNNIAGLRLGSSSLTVTGTGTKLNATLTVETGANASLNIGNQATFAADGAFINNGTINVGVAGASNGFLEGLGTLTNLGTINANRGAISIDVNNSKTFVVANTSGLMTVGGNFTNLAAGTVLVQGSTANTQVAFAGPVTNQGKIQLTSTTASRDVQLDFTGAGLKNQGSTAALQIDAGTGGSRVLTGNITNLAGTITINASTSYLNGTLTNGDPSLTSQTSTIFVASGKSLSFGSGSSFISSTSSTLTGTGVASSPATPAGSMTFFAGASAVINANTTIGLGLAFSLSDSATLTGSGTLTVNGNLAVFNNSTSSVNVSIAPTGFLSSGGNAQIGGNVTIAPGGSMAAIGVGASSAVVRVTGSLTNNGNVLLLAANATSPIPPSDITFDVSGGTFTNNGGLVSLAGGSGTEGGGLRIIKGSFTSAGFISISTDTIYTGGSLTNSGAINISVSKTLTIDTGATLISSGGNYFGGNTTNGPTNGKIVVGNGGTFQFNSSGTINTGMTVTVGDANGPGTVTGTGPIELFGTLGSGSGTINAPININSGGVLGLGGNGTVTVSSSTVNVHTGGVLAISAAQPSDANVKFTGGTITNAGTTVLTVATGTTAARSVTLDLSGATAFNIAAGGILITLANGPGGVREIIGPSGSAIFNAGGIEIQTDTVFSGTYTYSLVNQSGGLFRVAAGMSADFLGDGDVDNNLGGKLTINGFLNMHGNNLDNQGTIDGSGAISMGGGTFTNSGTSTITPGNSPGALTIDGNAVFKTGSHTVVELAGLAAGQFDTFTVTGHFTRGGSLDVVHYDGFVPQAGDTFRVMGWGTADGMFDAATGLADTDNGIALDPIFDNAGLTLMARPITHQGEDTDTTLTGSAGDDVMVGGSGHTVFKGGLGDDLMIGGTGDATFLASDGNDRIVGGAGENTLDLSNVARPVQVDLSAGTATSGAGDQDTIIGIQNVVGTIATDTIAGNTRDNVITGGSGADILTGGGGADTFVYNALSDGGDTITDFVSGNDIISVLDQAFGVQSGIVDGQNFSTIQESFNGSTAGNNGAFNAGTAAFIFSVTDSALYHDANGTGAGYTLVAHVEPGATITASDLHLFHGATT